MSGTLWINGRFRPLESPLIPAAHPLTLHGVGVFETLRLVAGRAPLLERHLDRARRSCTELEIKMRAADWPQVLDQLARRNRLRSGVARITWSHDLCFATLRRLPRDPSDGLTLPVRNLVRPEPGIKSTSWLDLWQAEQACGGEVALVGQRGQLLETSRANLFVVTAEGLRTARSNRVLPGICRDLVLEFARGEKIPLHQQAPRLRDWEDWLACFACNAVRGIRPVARLAEIELPNAAEEPLVQALQGAFDDALRR